MSTFTVRPTTLITNGGGLTATGGSPTNTPLANLGDNSDTSYVQHTTTTPVWWTFGLGSVTVPSDEFVCRVAGFLRWKDGSGAGPTWSAIYIGVNPYRSIDAKPGYVNSIPTGGQSTFITQEAGYASVAWSRTDVQSLRTLFYDSRNTASQATPATVAEIGANIYTLKNATATPQATTFTQSSFATIPVQVTATIDWEANTQDWQKLRTITIQVDVEGSSSTGIGTGVLFSRQYVDTVWTGSGTNVSYNVQLSDSLASGSYKVYARAIRHRENEATTTDSVTGTTIPSNSDQFGAWSSAATLTMSVTPPTAPTITVTADQVNDRQAVAVTLGSAGVFSSPKIQVQRSLDQTTWTYVRNAVTASATFSATTTVYDYEAPRGVQVYYRARVQAVNGSFTFQSDWSSSANATINSIDWNLKCPQDTTLNMMSVQIVGEPSETLTEEMGVFRALDRRYPVVVAGTLGGWDGDLTIQVTSDATWTALKALLESQKVLLLESPFGWSKYVRIVDGAKTTLQGTSTTPRRTVTLNYVQTDVP